MANGVINAIVVREIAFAGPVTMRRLEPNSAAIKQGTIAAYRPYWGGMPASNANAIPWGNTTIAPVSPARTSARMTPGFLYSGSHLLKGSCQFIRIKFALGLDLLLFQQA